MLKKLNTQLILFIFITMLSLNISAESIKVIGTYTDVINVDGKMQKKVMFESLPSKWGKNGNYYNAIMILDPENKLSKSEWKVKIEVFDKDKKIIRTFNVPKEKAKKIGNKYYLTKFEKLIQPIHEAPFTIKYSVNIPNDKTYIHLMDIKGGD